MKQLKFSVTFCLKRYNIYIDPENPLHFKHEYEAKKFISKFREVIHDNVLIIGNLHQQVHSLKQIYYQYLPFEATRELYVTANEYEKRYFLIYHNFGGENQASYQWGNINACFSLLEKEILILKNYAQRHKKSILLAQVYPLLKIYDHVYGLYSKEISGLTDGISYRSELIKLKSSTQDNETTVYKQNTA